MTTEQDEIARLRAEVARLTGELDAVSSAIGTTEYMDPPDGGDVPLHEQVRRMKACLYQTTVERNAVKDVSLALASAVGHYRATMDTAEARAQSAEAALAELRASVSRLCSQLAICGFTDELGHKAIENVTYIALRALIEKENGDGVE